MEERNRELRIAELRLSKKSEQFEEVKQSLQSDTLRLRRDAAALEDALAIYKEENKSLKSSMSNGRMFGAPATQGQIEILVIYFSFSSMIVHICLIFKAGSRNSST